MMVNKESSDYEDDLCWFGRVLVIRTVSGEQNCVSHWGMLCDYWGSF